jgi:DNA-binding transcriptional MerR regulator/quercetin dioxygenase-like cupin family protein
MVEASKRAAGSVPKKRTSQQYNISEVAKLLDVSPSTLRQWENMGLMKPTRTPSGYRTYSLEQIDRLKYIQRLRTENNLNIEAILHLLGIAGQSKPSNGRDSAPDSSLIARKLRKLRREQQMTLSEVAAKTGLSISFLSSLERRQVNASVATLRKLSAVYGTNILSFFEASDRTGKSSKLIRPRQRKQLSNEPGVRIELLALGQIAMEPHLFRIAPGATSGGSYHHDGEECVYVISGSCEFWLDEVEHYVLNVGDTLYFSSAQAHRWRNPGPDEAVLLWINTPATF